MHIKMSRASSAIHFQKWTLNGLQFHSASYVNILTHNKETIMQVESEGKVKEAVQS